MTTTTAEAWLGRPLAVRPSLDAVVLRYFGAFGPASVADVTTWCRLTGLREIVERLRPRLRTFRDESGRELFDLPDAPRPDPGTPAPARFLPEYDNLLLSHADRSRFRKDRTWFGTVRERVQGTVLHDGAGCGVWRIVRSRESATLEIEPVVRLSKRATSSIAAEGRRYLRFVAADAGTREVRVLSRS